MRERVAPDVVEVRGLAPRWYELAEGSSGAATKAIARRVEQRLGSLVADLRRVHADALCGSDPTTAIVVGSIRDGAKPQCP